MDCIFVHGMGQGTASWEIVIEEIQKKISLNAICPDLWSLLEGKDYTYNSMYSTFANYLNNYDSKLPLNLCGASFGGMLVLNYALDFPERVNSIILVGTRYSVAGNEMKPLHKFFLKILPTPPVIKNMGMTQKEFLSFRATMEGLDFGEKINDISCPALILCGENDNEVFKSAFKYFVKNIQNVSHDFIKNAGHMVNQDNPKELAIKVGDFLAKQALTDREDV